MTSRVLPASLLGPALVLGSATTVLSDPPGRAAVRVYTNEDLARVHELRDQTGVLSTPAVTAAATIKGDDEGRERATAERYWRGQAARTRDKQQALAVQAQQLRVQIEEREAAARRFGRSRRRASASDFDTGLLRARLASLEERVQLLGDELEERARKARALPGWLR